MPSGSDVPLHGNSMATGLFSGSKSHHQMRSRIRCEQRKCSTNKWIRPFKPLIIKLLSLFTKVQNIVSVSSEYEATCQRTGTWFPSYPCERECVRIPVASLSLRVSRKKKRKKKKKKQKPDHFLMFSCVAVDCGFPNIPEDGILQMVLLNKGRTVYKDQIQFKCSSKYYTLDGDGN